MKMAIQANNQRIFGILAVSSTWLTLAGFILPPSTVTSIKNSDTLAESKTGKIVQNTVQNIPVLIIAGLFCVIGITGTHLLWTIMKRNYIWTTTNLFQ